VRIRNPRAQGRRKSESTRVLGAPFGLRPTDFGLRISLCALLVAHACRGATTNAPDTIPPLRPPRGEIAPNFWDLYGVWVVIIGAVLLVAIGGALWRVTRPKPAVTVPPEVQARTALGSLLNQPEDGALLSRVSQILRHYVSAAFGWPPGEMTTTDFCRAVADDGRLGRELSTSLSGFLQECDQRKFAPPTPAPGLGAAAKALKLVDAAEAHRAELPAATGPEEGLPPSRAYRGASKS